jgi:hypothetical protein
VPVSGPILRHFGPFFSATDTPCQELERHLKDEPVLNVDETGWRTNGDKRFRWAFVAVRYVVYIVAATRAGAKC